MHFCKYILKNNFYKNPLNNYEKSNNGQIDGQLKPWEIKEN